MKFSQLIQLSLLSSLLVLTGCSSSGTSGGTTKGGGTTVSPSIDLNSITTPQVSTSSTQLLREYISSKSEANENIQTSLIGVKSTITGASGSTFMTATQAHDLQNITLIVDASGNYSSIQHDGKTLNYDDGANFDNHIWYGDYEHYDGTDHFTIRISDSSYNQLEYGVISDSGISKNVNEVPSSYGVYHTGLGTAQLPTEDTELTYSGTHNTFYYDGAIGKGYISNDDSLTAKVNFAQNSVEFIPLQLDLHNRTETDGADTEGDVLFANGTLSYDSVSFVTGASLLEGTGKLELDNGTNINTTVSAGFYGPTANELIGVSIGTSDSQLVQTGFGLKK